MATIAAIPILAKIISIAAKVNFHSWQRILGSMVVLNCVAFALHHLRAHLQTKRFNKQVSHLREEMHGSISSVSQKLQPHELFPVLAFFDQSIWIFRKDQKPIILPATATDINQDYTPSDAAHARCITLLQNLQYPYASYKDRFVSLQDLTIRQGV